MVKGLSWLLGHLWHGGNRWECVGAIFTVMETLEGETDLTTGFPDVENGGGEVLVVVAML